MLKNHRIAPLLLAGFLHFTPLANRALTGVALPSSPVGIVMRWVVGGLALAGTFHAVSAASAVLLSATKINGAVGTRLSYQTKISDGQNRLAESWVIAGQVYGQRGSATNGLPPGLSLSLSTGIISGVPTQAGTFDVPITAYEKANLGGGKLSFTLTFTITGGASPPTITTQPAGGSALEGSKFDFAVVASGSGTLSYQWLHDNALISGATTATLSLNPVQSADAGDYTVVVSNSGGNVTSKPATLTVTAAVAPPSITTPPSDVTLHLGESLTLTVVADGAGPLQYQWRHNGAALSGAKDATLTVSATSHTDSGSYDVVVANGSGSTTSPAATVTLVPLLVQVLSVNSYGTTVETKTISGRQYIIEAADALNAAWTSVTNWTAQGSVTTFVDTQTTHPQRYWRYRINQ